MSTQPITTPSKKDGLKGEVKFQAGQLKKQGKAVTVALAAMRKENAKFETDLGLSLLEDELREVVHDVYGTGKDWRSAFHTKTEALTLPENVQIVIRGLCNVGNMCIWGGLMKQLALLKESDENTKDAQVKLLSEIRIAADNQAALVLERFVKEKDELQKNLQDMAKTVQNTLPEIQIVTPAFITNIVKGVEAAHNLGVTLKGDLVQAYVAAKKAQDDFMASGIQDGVAQAAIANNILKAKAALEAYGQAEDKFKIKSHGIFQQLENDSKTGAMALDQWKQIGTNALSSITASAQGAITNLLLAQCSFGAAMLKATEQVLASVASQALIQGIFDEAKSFEAAAAFNYVGAAQYQTAADTMFVVAALAGGTAAGLSRAGGGGSGSHSTAQSASSTSNTGQSNRSGGGNVSAVMMASGGLVTGPTLAIVGEDRNAPTEAVLPLDNEEAMGKIRDGIGGGAGGGIHFHLPHGSIISGDTLTQLATKMSRAVAKGQISLTASNSLRLTKRSA